tara:strand:- start:15210 stop:15443 length:234 start_codon:yes stop_codon:yes gene_type:complete
MLGRSLTSTETLDQVALFKVITSMGTTYVIPCDYCSAGSHTCVLENSFIVGLLAKGLKIKNARYIEDGVRPCFLIEI